MADVDISAEAVERRIRELQEAGFDNAAATLRALRAERDTLAAANATLAEEIEEITAIADRGVVLHGEAAEIMSSLEAQRDAATAERDAARAALQRWQYYGCPDCGGDCASANPPIACCIMRETHEALTSAKEA